MRGDLVAACMIVAVGAFLAAIMFGFLDNTESYDMEMEFEDWAPYSSAALGTNGPVELVNGYVHATGIGTAEVINADGSVCRIRIVQASAVMVLMNGQSNAAYYQPIDPAAAIAPDRGTGFYFGRPDGMPSGQTEDISDCSFYDFVDQDGACRVGDKGPAFTRYYSELTGKKVIWISLGIPGRTISYWNGGLAWKQDVRIMDMATSMLPDGFRIDRTITLWSQGESDFNKDTGYEHYLTTWQAFHDSATAKWDIDAWYLVDGRTKTVGWVNGAFEELSHQDGVSIIAHGIADTFSVVNGLLGGDDIHYSQIGDNALATACAYDIAAAEGRNTGVAPIYLQETIERCDVDDSITMYPVLCHRVDGTSIRLQTTWDDMPDTSIGGIQVISGTAAASEMLLAGCPGPMAIIYVGYLGYVGGLEYCLNADGDAAVIGRNSLTLPHDVTIPADVGGYAVAELADYCLNWGPWVSIDIPDTVTAIGARVCQSLPLMQSMQISDSLESIGFHGLISLTFMDGDTEIGVVQYTANPSLLAGAWEWNGTDAGTLYKVAETQEVEP